VIPPPVIFVAEYFTESVRFDADDPAIVYNSRKPESSIIVATDKEKAPGGGLYAINLKGKVIGHIGGLNRPNNVDTLAPQVINGSTVQIVVTTERLARRLRVFIVDFNGNFTDVSGKTEVFRGEENEDGQPMGIACHGNDVYVTPKAGTKVNHVEKLTLVWNRETQCFDAISRQRFGNFTGHKETESIVVDPVFRRVFYSDELKGIWCYGLNNLWSPYMFLTSDPKQTGDHEGLALTTEYLVSVDQRKERTWFWLYNRKTLRQEGVFMAEVDETDGIDICTKPLGKQFPKGILVAMNSNGKNFAIFSLAKLKL
jgi:3-phytase